MQLQELRQRIGANAYHEGSIQILAGAHRIGRHFREITKKEKTFYRTFSILFVLSSGAILTIVPKKEFYATRE